MPLASVVLCTIRKQPHFDWWATGLSNQTFKDFSVIVIDDNESMERYKEIRLLCAKNNLVLEYYGRSKPSRWNTPKHIRPALCNARNTAIVVANSRFLVFHDDNGFAHPDWLARHMQWLQYGLLSAGTWYTYKDGDVKGGKFEGTPGPYGMPSESRAQLWPYQNMPAPAIGPDWLHGGNMGFSLQAALAVNGYDEYLDGEQGVDDADFSIRTRLAGYKVMFDPQCTVDYCTASHALTQHEVAEVKPEKAELQRMAEARKPKELVLKRDGKLHFANEYPVEQLLEGLRPMRANESQYFGGGPIFDLSQLRRQYRETLEIKHELGAEVDWRDGQPLREMA